MRTRLIAPIAVVLLALALAIPASAIVYGQPTGSDRYPNVGALVDDFEVDGAVHQFHICTATLIDDGDGDARSELVLTAAHCIASDRMWVSFDHDLETEPGSSQLVPGGDVLHAGTAYPHPDYACCGANDMFDIAVVVLDAEVEGSPAPIASPGLLDEMSAKALRRTVFTAVGYGGVRDTRKTGWQGIHSPDGVRSYALQTAQSISRAWFTLSMNQSTGDGGTCYGDSGGPHFLSDGTVVSVTVTGDANCKSTDKTYRVDSAVSQAFLAPILATH